MPELRLTCSATQTGAHRLHASVTAGHFSGQSSMVSDLGRLKRLVLPALRLFPLSKEAPPTISPDFRHGWDGLDEGEHQCPMEVRILSLDSLGHLLAVVRLAVLSPDECEQSVLVEFPTDYAAVFRFAGELEDLIEGRRSEAVLPGVAN